MTMTGKPKEITEILGDYKLVLGIEIHLHVNTGSKMFCSCSTEGIYNDAPNTHVCPVCLGMPGALPVPNKEAVEKTHLLGIALGCKINRVSIFDRKHYFYPDLPKGYQISQYKKPLCEDGLIELPSGGRVVLERIHLEEDTAKSFHNGEETLVDFNKSGIALIEVVTKPSIYSVDDAVEYAKQVQEVVRYLGVGEANMEKGQLRIEPNISLRTAEMEKAGVLPKYKVEVKNINSFKFMKKAIIAEIVRQRAILETGETPTQENRGYSEAMGKSISQRSKEEAHDYRYFPEPDIPPMEFGLEEIRNLEEKLALLQEQQRRGKEKEEQESAVKVQGSRAAIPRINDLIQLDSIVQQVLKENEKIVTEIKNGKNSAIEFLVGQAMKYSKGTANPTILREILKQKLLS